MKCIICKMEIIGYGNNAQPIAEGKCCDTCNGSVIIARRAYDQGMRIAYAVTCFSCNEMFDYRDEPQEVKEGGTHICPECWAEEE